MPAWLRYPSRPPPVPPPGRLRNCLLYFVPGNPGLIDYYAPFLATLRLLLDEVEDRQQTEALAGAAPAGGGALVRFHIRGRNLLGFDDGDNGDDGEDGEDGEDGRYGPGPYDLDTQIRAVRDKVCAARLDDGRPFDDVVLLGHSVGSYIAVEVVRRCQEAAAVAAATATHPPLRAGILLFATLTHLAASPSGRQLTRLLATPVLGGHVPELAQAVLHWCWPAWVLDRVVVRGVLGFPPHAAAATLRFLTSQGGVRQALFLGRDELVHIGEDVWADEVWGAAAGDKEAEAAADGADGADTTPPPKFVIFYGQNDHWVADDCRDRFIARRQAEGAQAGRVQIVLDDTGLPHAFCIRHGEHMAERVKTWVCAILLGGDA